MDEFLRIIMSRSAAQTGGGTGCAHEDHGNCTRCGLQLPSCDGTADIVLSPSRYQSPQGFKMCKACYSVAKQAVLNVIFANRIPDSPPT